MPRRVYIASPYSCPDPKTRAVRFFAACKAAARVASMGDLAFSPIAHSHCVACADALPPGFAFWRDWCFSFLRHWATHFVILEIPGWRESAGVAAEKALAKELGLPILAWADFMLEGEGVSCVL